MSSSTSSWGRELKYRPRHLWNIRWQVDLFVRSWVEIIPGIFHTPRDIVDLFVRSWVEIALPGDCGTRCVSSTSSWGRELKFSQNFFSDIFDKSTSSWGRELKYLPQWKPLNHSSRPLREVVSWNNFSRGIAESGESRPLREVVSWNFDFGFVVPGGVIVDLFVRSWVEIFAEFF